MEINRNLYRLGPLKMLSSWTFVKKRREQFCIIVLPKEKKNKPFFLKDLCTILCQKNKKNSSENFFFKKQVLLLLVYEHKEKKTNKALCRKLWSWLKWCSFWFLLLPKTKLRTLAFGKKKHVFFLSFSELFQIKYDFL